MAPSSTLLLPSDIAATLLGKDLLDPKQAALYLHAYNFFAEDKSSLLFIDKGGRSISFEDLEHTLDALSEKVGVTRNGLISGLIEIVTSQPEAAEMLDEGERSRIVAEYEEFLKENEQISGDAKRKVEEDLKRISRLVQGSAIEEEVVEKKPVEKPAKEDDVKTTTSQLALETINQTLDELPLNEVQKGRVKAIISEHETASELADIFSKYTDPEKPLTAHGLLTSQQEIQDKLYQELGNQLSPTALNVLSSRLSPLTATSQLIVALKEAEKSGGVVLLAEPPVFETKSVKAQEQIEKIQNSLPPGKIGEIISQTVDQKYSKLSDAQRSQVKNQLATGIESLGLIKAGVTPDGLFELIQNGSIQKSFQAAGHDLSIDYKTSEAAYKTTATRGGKIPRLQVVIPSSTRVSDQGLTVSTNNKSYLIYALPQYRQSARQDQTEKAEAASPSQFSILQRNGKISVPVPKNKAFEEIFARINLSMDKINTPFVKLAFQFDHSPVGIPLRKFNVLINRTLPRAVSSWVAKQGVVIAIKKAGQEVGKKIAEFAAKQVILKGAAELAASIVEAGSIIGIPLAIASIGDFLKNLWDLLQQLGPLLKKFFDDHPWIFPLMMLAPLFPVLGIFGPILFALGALGILGLLAAGGTVALAGMGAGLGGVIAAGLGFLISFPVIFPIILAIVIFLGLWVFFVVFYEVFLIPQGFMTNLTSGQIAPLLSQKPVYFTVAKTANPTAISNTRLLSSPTISYSITISPAAGFELSNIKITEVLTLIDGKTNPNPPKTLSPTYSIPTSPPYSYSLSLGGSFLSQNGIAVSDLQNSILRNEITVTADARDTKTNQTLTSSEVSSAAVTIGEPQLQDPCGWPIWGDFGNGRACVVQGPNGPFSHSGIQAVDIAGPPGLPVYSTHPGFIKWGYDPYDGNFVRVISADNSYQTIYAHLDNRLPQSTTIVPKSSIVGYTTFDLNNGLMTGFHLHYQLKGSPSKGPLINKYLPPPAPIDQNADESSCASRYPVRKQDANNCPTN